MLVSVTDEQINLPAGRYILQTDISICATVITVQAMINLP